MSHVETLAAGTELAGDFRIEKVLDAGGFGITYLAREIALDRMVAIKEYFPADFAARRDQRSAVPRSGECGPDYEWGLERFIEEAQVLARFDHPNIVRVYRYFRENNTAYIVLKFEEGRSFKSWLAQLGRAPRQPELDRLVAPLLEALAVVHAAGMLHRDIAPDNIIVRDDGSPVLIDFGAARGDLAQHTRTVSALVKPGYSPYEQYAEIGKQQGPWTDIYALAATLYHATTGKRPPDSPSRVVRDELVPAREAAVSAYRARFLKAIDRGLRLDIEKRPQSVAEWRGDLLAPEAKAQRSWFAAPLGRRQGDGDGDGSEDDGELAQTVMLAAEGEAANGVMPPPPDVPGRRGRIVDFLEGVRPSPRKTSMLAARDEARSAAASATGGTSRARLEASAVTAGEASGAARSAADAAARSEGRASGAGGGLLTRLSVVSVWHGMRRAGDGRGSDAVAQAGGAGAVAAAPDGGAGGGAGMAPVRLASRWRKPLLGPARPSRRRWLGIVARLGVGAGVAALAVTIQDALPQWQRDHERRMAESRLPPLPAPAPLITGSFARRDGAWVGRPSPGESPRGDVAGGDVAGGMAVAGALGYPAGAATMSGGRTDPAGSRGAGPLPAEGMHLIRTFEAHRGGVSQVGFGKDGRVLVTAGEDGALKVWDGLTFAAKRTIELADGPAFSLAVRGEQALVGQENGRIGLWHLDLGLRLKSFKRNDAPVTTLAFAGANRFLAGASDWTVTLWDMGQPSVALHTFEGHERDVLAVAFQERAGLIASGSADRSVKVWAARSLSLARQYPRQRSFVTAIAFSPDGEGMLVGTLEGEIMLYATESRRRIRRYGGHEGRVTALRFTGDGRRFVSASADGTIRLWDREQPGERQTFGAAGAAVRSVAVSGNGDVIVSGKADGTVQVWHAEPGE